MIRPADDFDDDFVDDESVVTESDVMKAPSTRPDSDQHDTRKKIEALLEKRRLKEEFGDLDFD